MEQKKNVQETMFQKLRHSIYDFSSAPTRIFGMPQPPQKTEEMGIKGQERAERMNNGIANTDDTRRRHFERPVSAPVDTNKYTWRRSMPPEVRRASSPKPRTSAHESSKLLRPHDENSQKRPISPMQATIMIQSDF